MTLAEVDESVFRKETNELLVVGELPLAFIESVAWKSFCSQVNLYKPHFQRTTTRDIVEMYVKQKTTLKATIGDSKQRISLTTNIWVAPTTVVSYMVITAHFVDASWKLKKFIIGFKHVLDHKKAIIAEVLLECLAEWGIEKIFTIIVDNATANTYALKRFKEAFKVKGNDALVLDGIHDQMSLVAALVPRLPKIGSIYKQLLTDEGIDDKSNELEIYLKESVENPATNSLGTEFDVLPLWRGNSHKFPVLSEIAKYVLAMQVSYVASESSFSTSGRIIEPQKSCLTHYMIEVLICMEQWLKSDQYVSEKEVENFNQMIADIEEQDGLEKDNTLTFKFW